MASGRRPDLRANPVHLAGRLLASVAARSLSPREQNEVSALLRDEERAMFWSQPIPDQRHGHDAARAVLRSAPGRTDLARAALLHDIGKRHAGMGSIRRSLASAVAILGLPPTQRQRAYLEHDRAGAEDLDAAGAGEVVVGFARHHHHDRPSSIPENDWAMLVAADDR